MLMLLLCALASQAPKIAIPASWSAKVPSFNVAGNIYYVGTQDLASYLIATPEGHILIDSGLEQNADAIAAGIRALGFDVKDVRILLTTQAHFDHVAAHARLKAMSGGRLLATDGDAPLLEGGGKGDYLFGPKELFPPVAVDGRLADGQQIRLGATVLTVRSTPGHTQGTATYTTTVRDDGRERLVVVAGSTSVNPGTKLVNNTMYPTIAEDYARSFTVLQGLKPDVFLAAHASAMGGLSKAGKIGYAEYSAYLARSRRAFEAELAAQRAK
jgi:metallo-beta-lactamase class B